MPLSVACLTAASKTEDKGWISAWHRQTNYIVFFLISITRGVKGYIEIVVVYASGEGNFAKSIMYYTYVNPNCELGLKSKCKN